MKVALGEKFCHVTCRAGPDDVGHYNALLFDSGATRLLSCWSCWINARGVCLKVMKRRKRHSLSWGYV